MAIAIGCDEAGFELKQILKQVLVDRGLEVEDFGTYDARPVLYPDIAFAAAQSIVDGRNDRGVLLCGTGIGMAISANKVPGIRATTAHDSFSAERSVLSNNCQVLTMGQRVVGLELARRLAKEWIGYEFDEGSASAEKVAVITDYEHEHAAPVEPRGA